MMSNSLPENFCVHRRKLQKNSVIDDSTQEGNEFEDCNGYPTGDDQSNICLTLMEEILLLALKDREGYSSFWNDCLSSGLRGCMIAELALRNRIELAKPMAGRRSLISRKVLPRTSQPTEDTLLDETLRHISSTMPAENVLRWVEYLSGESFNPFKLRYQLRNVRERIAKNLAEKGVLTTDKRNFVFFELTTHPLQDPVVKRRVIKKIQDGLLDQWTNDIQKMNKRLLALIVLAHACDVLENALASLKDHDYSLAMKRMRVLLNSNFESESRKKPNSSEDVMWAVFEVFVK